MDGQGLDSWPWEQSSEIKLFFKQLFQAEISELIEHSFDANPEAYGTCILGKGKDFLNRFFQFTEKSGLKAKPHIRDTLEAANSSDYGLKVDWQNESANQITLYLRYTSESREKALTRAFSRDFQRTWTGPTPDALAAYFQSPSPFCLGLRLGVNTPPTYSAYIEVDLSHPELKIALSCLLLAFNWPNSLCGKITQDIQLISKQRFRGCVGISSDGQTLKIDLAGASLGASLKFLKTIQTSPRRIKELTASARQLQQLQTNYFALKYNASGLIGWKMYFASMNQHIKAVAST